jgi:putative ABC transport system permease protein
VSMPRDPWGRRHLDALAQDVRFGVRTMKRSPAFTVAVIVTLGLSVGACAAVFGLVRGVLLRELPYANGDRVVRFVGTPNASFSVPDIEDYRAQNRTLARVAEYGRMDTLLSGAGEPERITAARVSADFFEVFNVRPWLGRTFVPGEDRAEAEPAVVLGHGFWRRHLGGDPSVVGRSLRLDERAYTVIGVLPPLPFPDEDIVVPFTASAFRMQNRDKREGTESAAFGLLAAGISREVAEADLRSVLDRLVRTYPEAHPSDPRPTLGLVPLRSVLAGDAQTPFLLLLGTTALLVLLAGVNIVNLSLARFGERAGELALRSALGAGRGRVLRQLVTESVILSLAGGMLALLFTAASRASLVAFASRFSPRAEEIQVDAAVFAFALGLSILLGLVVGSARAFSGDPMSMLLRDEGHTTGDRPRQILRPLLVAGQTAISLVVLISAALLLRSFGKLTSVERGFRSEGVLAATVHYDASTRERRGASCSAFQDGLVTEARTLPGVAAAANAGAYPLMPDYGTPGWPIGIEGQPQPAGGEVTAQAFFAGPGYFQSLGIPVVAGRAFEDRDSPPVRAATVAIVSRQFARRHFEGRDPLGQRISTDGGRSWMPVVGVVGDVRQSGLQQPPEPTVYLPQKCMQFPWTLLVRASGDPRPLTSSLRALVTRLDSRATLYDVRTLNDVLDSSLASPRLMTTLLGAFAFVAMGISLTGIAGVIAYTAGRRRREMAIRICLGAARASLRRLLLQQCGLAILSGVGAGLAGAMALAPLLSSQLFGILPTDLPAFILSTLVLLLGAAFSALLAARSTVRVDPARLMRAE